MKLHLGCGNKHIDGWVNVDTREPPGVDLVDNVQTLDAIQLDSVDVIYASHVLEHTGRMDYMLILQRWYNLLKLGGLLRIAVPDIQQVLHHYNLHKDLRMLRGFLWGGQTYPQNYHYCGWDFQTLSEDLKTVGFSEARVYDWRTTEHAHIDDFSQAYLPHMDKENGVLMSLNVEAIK